MATLSQNLTTAYRALHTADAQELVIAAKALLAEFLADPENLGDLYDARDSAMTAISQEAEARLWLGDDDPEHIRNGLLDDVVAIAFQYFN